MTTNHCRRILHTTRGDPGRWNDQTMVTYDKFIRGIYEGNMLNENKFVYWKETMIV